MWRPRTAGDTQEPNDNLKEGDSLVACPYQSDEKLALSVKYENGELIVTDVFEKTLMLDEDVDCYHHAFCVEENGKLILEPRLYRASVVPANMQTPSVFLYVNGDGERWGAIPTPDQMQICVVFRNHLTDGKWVFLKRKAVYDPVECLEQWDKLVKSKEAKGYQLCGSFPIKEIMCS